jgi:hypothetical protein
VGFISAVLGAAIEERQVVSGFLSSGKMKMTNEIVGDRDCLWIHLLQRGGPVEWYAAS